MCIFINLLIVFVNSALKIQCHVVKIRSYRLLFSDFAYWERLVILVIHTIPNITKGTTCEKIINNFYIVVDMQFH